MKYTSKQIGRCLTEYRLETLEEVKVKCVLFFTVPQYRNVEGFDLLRIEELNIKTSDQMPNCGHGMKVYGVLPDRSTVRLVEIVDSSD